ncbi:hypothetical protein [Deinococcus sp.]|uniref:hypothetical protein n=1 Tax=Deinococcus sp. TaxID=47478 RepID=UPI003CC538C4
MSLPAWWSQTVLELAPLLPGLRVAFYASGGAPYHHAALVAHWGGVPHPLSAGAIRGGALGDFDVLIVPGGGLNGMSGLLAPLGADGAGAIRDWVEAGGMYVGSCAGAYLPARWPQGFAREHAAQQALNLLDVEMANASEAGLGGLDSPGVGVVQVAVQAPAHWLTDGLPERFQMVHYNGPCFLPPPEWAVTALIGTGSGSTESGGTGSGSTESGGTESGGTGAGFTPWERMLPTETLVAPLLAERLTSQGCSNVVAGSCGDGQVVLFGSHPEFGFDALQLGWGAAARMLGNALAYQATQRAARPPLPVSTPGALPATPLGALADDFARAGKRLAAFRPDADALVGAPGFLGRAPADLFSEALRLAAEVNGRVARALRQLAGAGPIPAHLSHWVSRVPEEGQDYGFVGLIQLAARLHALIDSAEQRQTQPPAAFPSPYGHWDQHPYHLLASSYLSAAGLSASAALASGTLIRLGGHDIELPHALTSPPHLIPQEQP